MASVSNLRTATAISGASSTTLTYSGAVTAGSTLVMGSANYNTSHGTPAVSDSVNGSWSPGTTTGSYGAGAGDANIEDYLYSFPNTSSGTPVVTNNPAGSSTDVGTWFIAEVLGALSSSRDIVNKNGELTANNTPSIASGTLAQADEVIFAMMTGSFGGTPSVTALSGDGTYTEIVNNKDQSVQMGQAQYKIVSSTASDTADWSVTPATSPNPGDSQSVLISIKVSAGGGGG